MLEGGQIGLKQNGAVSWRDVWQQGQRELGWWAGEKVGEGLKELRQ